MPWRVSHVAHCAGDGVPRRLPRVIERFPADVGDEDVLAILADELRFADFVHGLANRVRADRGDCLSVGLLGA
jgi:hypothetical protein